MQKQIKVSATYGVKTQHSKLDEWQQKAHPYTVTLKYDGRQMTLPFFMGSALTHEPTDKDVLPCLFSDSWALDQSFEDWAADFGYDSDSRKAEAIYKACKRNGERLQKLLGADYAEIQKRYEDQ